MKKIWVTTSLILNGLFLVFLAGSACFIFFRKNRLLVPSSDNLRTRGGEGRFSVACIMPTSHVALEEVRRGFAETLARKYGVSCAFDVYNANGSRALMRSQIEDVVRKKYDLIVPVGAMATQMTKEVTAKKKRPIPVVFCAVADPVRLNLVNSLESSGNNLTGSATSPNYPLQVQLLLTLRPDIKNVLLVYDPSQSSGLEKDKNQVAQQFQEHGVIMRAVEVYSPAEVMQKAGPLVSKFDMVMVLKDNSVVAAMDALVQLCSRHNVLLYVSDLASVSKGAALGFGVHEYQFGADAALCAKMVLVDGLPPSEVPIKLTEEFKLGINTQTMVSQHLTPGKLASEKTQLTLSGLWQLMKSVEFINPYQLRVQWRAGCMLHVPLCSVWS